jgi:hypothetical protein
VMLSIVVAISVFNVLIILEWSAIVLLRLSGVLGQRTRDW